MALFQKRSICVVTGASRGLGREIAIQFSKEWDKAGIKSDVVITARNEKGLEETKSLIISQAPGVNVHIVTGDLSDMDALPAFCTKIVELIDTSQHEQGVLVHNAATMNEFVPFLSQNDPKKIQAYLDTNVTSMIVLTTRFLSAFPTENQKHYVVHMSSILYTVYSKWYSMYSTVKAARTAFMGSLCKELPAIRQLSYGPGPCDTDMLRESPTYTYSVEGIKILTCEKSILKLVQILKDDKYENGCTIDYYNRK